MANIKGRLMVVKIGMDDGPPETFQTIGGQRDTADEQSNNPVDVSSKDTTEGFTAWDASLGLKDVQWTVEGILSDNNTAITRLLAVKDAADPVANFRMILGDGNRRVGSFIVENFSRRGPHQGITSYSCSLRNAGDVTTEADV